jgi:hypothetical protein
MLSAREKVVKNAEFTKKARIKNIMKTKLKPFWEPNQAGKYSNAESTYLLHRSKSYGEYKSNIDKLIKTSMAN